ncbi:caspase domain-containing protein [Crepidotus variabilis]|uniref:Caspase domain-containing protein n=1 Tax=Crepidotus variabilis TaxID=179855 RepID=A0A9P6EE74_9AGAR|nr:caspase domain-containing protein [Crepidotus variabilis]
MSTVTTPIPPILALVVGINEYPQTRYPSLRGAVRDADAFEDYLMHHLNVPASNITSLRNGQATRRGILAGFESLLNDRKYARGECAVVIFYAGHGAQTNIPEEWGNWSTATGRIEQLCPCDIGTKAQTDKGEEEEVDGIPDRTISALLNKIAKAKGSNITLILDCCCSAGINRLSGSLPYPQDFLPRWIKNPPPLRPFVDQEICRGVTPNRGGKLSDRFAGEYHASHVLLAACGRDQVASEKPEGGLFTNALMKVLRSEDIQTLTYTALMDKLEINSETQTPHCEGRGIYQRLFNEAAPGADESFVPVELDDEGLLKAYIGEAQGVTVGSCFSIHENNLIDSNTTTSNPSLGHLYAEAVTPFSSTLSVNALKLQFGETRLWYAKLVHIATPPLLIYSENSAWLQRIFTPIVLENLGVDICEDVSSCDLQLTLEGESVAFNRHSPNFDPLGSRIDHSQVISANDHKKIQHVVKAYRHFHYHLKRLGPNDLPLEDITMEFKKLETHYHNDFSRVLTPVGENLIKDNTTYIDIDEDADFGLTIVNDTDTALYPYIFYFDPTSLSIVPWYEPPVTTGPTKFTNADAPLPPDSELCIGYGNGGVAPWQFTDPENGGTVDLGFFKMFLATQPTYFSSIAQASPFTDAVENRGVIQVDSTPEPLEGWGTKTAKIIQLVPEHRQ